LTLLTRINILTVIITVSAVFTSDTFHRCYSTCGCIRTISILALLAVWHGYAVAIIIVVRSVCTISTVLLERGARLMFGVCEISGGSI
jgi:hypothetical protein